jgi:hypothetical protein
MEGTGPTRSVFVHQLPEVLKLSSTDSSVPISLGKALIAAIQGAYR